MKSIFIVFIVCACCSSGSGKKIRWCTVSEAEQKKCADLAKALAALLPPTALASFGRMSCVKSYSTADCVNKISANRADAVTLDAGEVYTAVKQFDLTTVAKEIYKDGGCVFAIAVVRNTELNIGSLKGWRSCHSGIRWTAGWSLPLGFLLSRNHLHWAEEQTLNQAVSTFFNASCVPGATTIVPSLCALCQGEKSYAPQRNFHCETSHNEPFYNSQGALRCLRAGKGDVAFVDHIALESIDEEEKDDYRLLCADGSKGSVNEFSRCNLGQGPGGAVVTRLNHRKIVRKFLTAIQVVFGRQGRQRQRFQLFESHSYGSNNLLFQDATDRLAVLPDDADISQILGLDYVALLKGLGHEGSTLEDSVIRWCCISAAEQRKCEQWALSIKSDPLVCVRASSMSNCIEKIKKDEVDAASLDATHAFIAGKCGLVPVATEYYGKTNSKCMHVPPCVGHALFISLVFPSVFAVAVVRQSKKNMLLENLAGRRSCHGHMYSPAGWLLPARHILISQPNDSSPCDPSMVYRQVFWKGCLPGSKGGLCKVCVGGKEEPGTKRCVDNHNEHYYGNMGALRCLVGDLGGKSYGDVAFLEQYNLEDNIQKLSSSGWSQGLLTEDFELLCADGRRAPLSQWENCHMGAVPPNVIMTRPVLTSRVYDFLKKSQETLQSHSDLEFQLFESHSYGESDLLFKDATRCLIHTSHLDYRNILGEEFQQAVEAVFNCTHADTLKFCRQDSCSMF
ncbi:saxiphilin-like [Arapaima gigas]